jgi:hypothetical protein
MCIGSRGNSAPPRQETSGINITMPSQTGTGSVSSANTGAGSTSVTGGGATFKTMELSQEQIAQREENRRYDEMIANQQKQIDMLTNQLATQNTASESRFQQSYDQNQQIIEQNQAIIDKPNTSTAGAKGFANPTLDQATPDADAETPQGARRKKAKGKRGLQIKRANSAVVRGQGSGLNIPKG